MVQGYKKRSARERTHIHFTRKYGSSSSSSVKAEGVVKVQMLFWIKPLPQSINRNVNVEKGYNINIMSKKVGHINIHRNQVMTSEPLASPPSTRHPFPTRTHR